MNWFWVVAGLSAVVVGAEVLVRGAATIASALRISQLVIGLTVVAFGTSAPEMAVSVISSLRDEPELALGNVVGSNIFNVLFVLGASAMIVPLLVSRQLIRVDIPLMIGTSIVVFLLALDGRLSRLEGAALFAGLISYTCGLIWAGRREADRLARESTEDAPPPARLWTLLGNLGLFVAGLGLLVLGASWLVDGSSAIARSYGVSDLVIGVTIVAVGTSLPEVATSLVAAIKGQRDLAVGNVVGSNIFNLLGVLGLSAVVPAEGMLISAEVLQFDLPIMLLVAVICLPIALTQSTVSRIEGLIMLTLYMLYMAYMVLKVQQSGFLDEYRHWVLIAVIPAMIATLLLIAWRDRARTAPLPTGE